jgi:hypothetical protein
MILDSHCFHAAWWPLTLKEIACQLMSEIVAVTDGRLLAEGGEIRFVKHTDALAMAIAEAGEQQPWMMSRDFLSKLETRLLDKLGKGKKWKVATQSLPNKVTKKARDGNIRAAADSQSSRSIHENVLKGVGVHLLQQ